MASISPAVFTLLLCFHVSSLVHGRPVPADSKMSLSMDYNPVDGGNAVSIAGSRSYIPGGDDTLADSKMFMLHKKSLHYNPVAGGDNTLAASKMSIDGRGHLMHPEKSLDYNPQGGNAVSRRYIPSGDDMLAASCSCLFDGSCVCVGEALSGVLTGQVECVARVSQLNAQLDW
ncbi:hypothetical protein SASPL_136656 [Salvia splendens]|uniref:Uncharacterized protein n=1 Tax=Salvia splendens TaxID=180675 RepID=A0A8X8X0B1_SALSN|nr:hypothetical protein SASPL_136656 [Salvia splendens]